MHVTGEWVMRFLVLVLLATPLARYGWPRLARYRRMLGLYVWFYATLHLLVFAQVYIGWSGEQLLEELADRPYVLVGFLAWLILVPLGITSARVIRKKMGKYWRQLHKLTYVVVDGGDGGDPAGVCVEAAGGSDRARGRAAGGRRAGG